MSAFRTTSEPTIPSKQEADMFKSWIDHTVKSKMEEARLEETSQLVKMLEGVVEGHKGVDELRARIAEDLKDNS